MKYIINTKFKKTKNGGIYFCKIYEIYNDGYFNLRDITEEEAKNCGLNYIGSNIKIPFGCGTGYNRLSQLLGKENCIDISFDN